MSSLPRRRRIVHVVYGFSAGGLENVIVQLVNRLCADGIEHAVLSLATVREFKHRVTQTDVRFIELNKPPGHAVLFYPRIYKLLCDLRPDVVRTRNLAGLEVARVPLLAEVESTLSQANIPRLEWLAGERNQVADMLRMRSCFVLPSLAGGTARALQEAMASGLPLVATAVGDTPEVVGGSITGLPVPSGDAEARAHAVWSRHADAATAHKLAQSVRRQTFKMFGIDAMVDACKRLFSGQQLGEPVGSLPGYCG